MKIVKVIVVAVLLLIPSFIMYGQHNKLDDPKMEWWKEAKFGMFIHWGLYSIPAGEMNGKKTDLMAEWLLKHLEIPIADYKALAKEFNPAKFNADEYVLLAKEAGMKYIVLTSKHHDGFAMFKSADPFNVVDATPYKKDIVKALADACAKHNIAFGLYYSQAQDWIHPGGGSYGANWDKAQDGDFDKYLSEVAVPQVKEILAYNPKIIWWDSPAKMTPERAAVFAPVLATHPNLITNDRLGGGVAGDLETPEQHIPATGIPGKNWEACMTMNGTWGYSKFDNNWKSTQELLRNLIDIASKGGNYLLNIGPNAEGEIPQPSIDRLKEVGAWMKTNGESIYGTGASPFSDITWGRVTQKTSGKNTKLYLHVFDWPADGKLSLTGLSNKIVKAYPLAHPSVKLKYETKQPQTIIDLKGASQQGIATVIVLEIVGKAYVYAPPVIKSEYSVFTGKAVFDLSSDINNCEIHYTIDGTEPTISSPIGSGKIEIESTQSIIIKARAFINQKPVSAISDKKLVYETTLPAIATKGGLRMKYYVGEWSELPDFDRLVPFSVGTVAQVDLSLSKQHKSYGVAFDGYLKVPETGIYTFFISSDDGSRLIIDDHKVLDNDNIHGIIEKSMEVSLEAGLHKIAVRFFQKSGGDGLTLEWKTPTKAKAVIGSDFFVH